MTRRVLLLAAILAAGGVASLSTPRQANHFESGPGLSLGMQSNHSLAGAPTAGDTTLTTVRKDVRGMSGSTGGSGGAPPSGEASSFVVAAPALRHGTLSYVDAKYGADYLALPEPRGTVARICGPADCVTRRSTDYGPDQRVHPDRIADLSAADFVRVCGVPLSAGLCVGTVELEPPVSPADDAARVEDGGPRPTVPATDMEGVP